MNEDLFSKSFDHLLAFVLPGLVAIKGYSYFDPGGLGAWFGTAATTDTTVGGFLFLVLAALGVGVFLSGLRWFVLEYTFHVFPAPPSFDDSQRTKDGVQDAYADTRNQHFYYYLFYANMLLAVLIVLIGWSVNTGPSLRGFLLALVAFIFVEAVLFFSAQNAIDRFATKSKRILGIVEGER